jgi:hypothetical protein
MAHALARTMPVCQVVTEIGAGLMGQADKAAVTGTANATGRRQSESRMSENLAYGSRWQGMETRIVYPRGHPLTLPKAQWLSHGAPEFFR